MKFSIVAASVAIMFSLPSQSAEDDSRLVNEIKPGEEKIKSAIGYKLNRENLYFVQLKDKALAAYKGDVVGLRATSLEASNNKTADGKLNTRSLVSKQYKNFLSNKQEGLIGRLSVSLKRQLTVKHQYNTVTNAIAVYLSDKELQVVKLDQDVMSVEKVGRHFIQTDSGPAHVQAPQIWNNDVDSKQTKGEGVIVGIIDTGINASHPSFYDVGADGYDHVNPLGAGQYLGDCQTFAKFCNDKLIGIVSFPDITENRPSIINDTEFTDIEDKVKVGYDFHGHGSHVASTAAGNVLHDVNYYLSVEDDIDLIESPSAFEFNQISGVAPHANIVSYQVCDENGCYPDLTVVALEHAIENGVDVINYSVGGSPRDPWSSIDGVAFLNARKAGIHVATSAGNSGPEPETIGSPGNSPWITTVAAYTHGRDFSDKTLSQFSGGETLPAVMTGKGATKALSGNLVLAADYGNAGCLEPFEADTFNNQIVVCERGEIARVRKGVNVQAGGAGGLVLINVDEDVDSISSDNHVIPAIHLPYADGVVLKEWLATGTDHHATIGAASAIVNDELADIAGVFSSRGPNLPYASIFGPDIAAPGVDIYAANAEDKPFQSSGGLIPYTTMSGTSMSSPHVAGMLALIHAVNPDWTPAEVQSALMTTAFRTTFQDDDFDGEKQRADFFTQGAGSARVFDAVNAGLILDSTYDEYVAADPTKGGDLSSLNLSSASLVECLASCSWERIVEATETGTWQVSYDYFDTGFELSATPSQFSLAKGESQTITFTATANIDLAKEWVHGYVVYTNNDVPAKESHFQASINFKAGDILSEVYATIDNKQTQLVIEDVVTIGTDELQTKAFGLFPSQVFTGQALGAENELDRKAPYRNEDILVSKSIVVKPYTKKLIVEITDSTAPDMDLYVGIDEDGNGLPNALEMYYSLLCISGNEDSVEKCELNSPPSGNYWIVAHNFLGSESGVKDDVTMRVAQIGYTYDASIDVDAPKMLVQDELFDINLTINGWLNESEGVEKLVPGDIYYGLLEVGTIPELKRNVGATLLKVKAGEYVNSAPQQITENDQQTQFELSHSDTNRIQVDLTTLFSDLDGDNLVFSVESDSNAIQLEDNILTFDISEEGTISLPVSASDGQESTLANIDFSFAFENRAPTSSLDGSTITLELSTSSSVALSENVATWFSDLDDDALTYSIASGEGLTLIGTLLEATYTQAGTYDISIKATDGEDEITAMVMVVVAPNSDNLKNSFATSGGSVPKGMLILLSLFVVLTRLRKYK